MTRWLLPLALLGVVPAGFRWLRVAQREHYLPGSASRFAARWWTSSPANVGLAAAGVAAVGLSAVWPAVGSVAALVAGVGPLGLGVRGRSSPLAWTRRLQRLAGGTVVVAVGAVLLAAAAGVGDQLALAAGLALPLAVDLAAWASAPLETGLGSGWVRRAGQRLAQVEPVVVAITGSFGKTTTKEYLRHLLSGRMATVASPASFNNRMGLARTINEHLAPGTQVLVAEMGTYGPGEIADLCRWVGPRVGVITAIGPVHLERFGSLEAITAAKAEILAGAEWAVLNVDDPRLAELADRRAGSVIRCSTGGSEADVVVTPDGSIRIRGDEVGVVPAGIDFFPGNLACAIGAALAVGLRPEDIMASLRDLPTPQHRQTSFVGPGGYTVIDDTYNSNPAGARAALDRLRRAAPAARRVVVTPGMVELGDAQAGENRVFAAAAASSSDHLVVVGRTNRRALLEGAAGGSASVIVVDHRQEAVAWVKANLGPGDAVLYENDLPDHYP